MWMRSRHQAVDLSQTVAMAGDLARLVCWPCAGAWLERPTVAASEAGVVVEVDVGDGVQCGVADTSGA